jgi:hypothetical protein
MVLKEKKGNLDAMKNERNQKPPHHLRRFEVKTKHPHNAVVLDDAANYPPPPICLH